jgi:AraC-like DNA-binding protein
LNDRPSGYDDRDSMTPAPTTLARLYASLGDEHGESLFEQLPHVQFWIKGRDGRYLRVNRALLRNYGFDEPSAMVGRTDHELMPPHLAAQYVRDDLAVLGGAVIRNRVELVARPDHSTGWHATDKIPLRSRRGRIIATAGITRDLDASAVAATSHSTLGPVVDHIRTRYAEPLDKGYLAHLLRLSVRSLERRFRAAFGISPLQYQRKLRMHQACRLLVTTDRAITGIALELGYSDHSHFTREFRRGHGLPPLAYRQRWTRHASL